MGEDKGLIRLAGKPLIEHVLERLLDLGDEVILTTNQPASYAYLGLKMAQDANPGQGALAGLYTALQAANGERVLVVACDMPFLNRKLLEYMLGQGADYDVIVPRWQGRYEPLHAVYARHCLALVRNSLQDGGAKMTDFFAKARVMEIEPAEIEAFDPEGRSFFNINTPQELKLAEEILNREG
jgi:molybdopterin-guanine dinucleotide biosynthesis protein A